MGVELVLIAIATLLMSALLTGLTRVLASSRGVIDVPNHRSSHLVPTPRGGGIATVIATTVAVIVLALLGTLNTDLLVVLSAGGVAVAIAGFVDDHRSLPVGGRLAVHFGAAIWAFAWLDGLPPLVVGDQLVSLGTIGSALGVLGVVWSVNLFNFMDGIDGLAASEAMFIAAGGAATMVLTEASDVVPAVAIIFVAACGGFLLWNWPPAKIFMGDVGSGYLGYVIAVLALFAARENPSALLVWLILGGFFFADATVTLIRRLIRRERVYEAHRSHGYQWLARRWGSHRRVTVAVMLLNLLWLFPFALLATFYPNRALWIVAVALLPVVIGVVAAGAGRRENGCADNLSQASGS